MQQETASSQLTTTTENWIDEFQSSKEESGKLILFFEIMFVGS